MDKKYLQKLQSIVNRYDKINAELETPEVLQNIKKYTTLNKELSHLREIVDSYIEYKNTNKEIIEAKQILKTEKDDDLIEMAKFEIKELEPILTRLSNSLEVLLLPQDPNDDKNVIVEIRGATGGDEANIFAGDLYKMYSQYAEVQNWKLEVLNISHTDNGHFSQISFKLTGDKVYSKMKFETGAHRVQRVPQTESQGRIHTSTATVSVFPEVDAVEVHINLKDLKIDTYRSGGAGGQHVNTTDSAVRVTHLPTKIVATSQDGRSQHDNKDKAMQALRAKIYQYELEKQAEKMSGIRKLAGNGSRSEKIRTYNYPQNRITDHRIGLTLNKLDQVMSGKIEEIISALITEDQRLKLLETIDNDV